MTLHKRQQKILDQFVNDPHNRLHERCRFVSYDELPGNVRSSLEAVKNQETLWCDAERYLNDQISKRAFSR